MLNKSIVCQECGMTVPEAKHYHPYSACLLFKATGDSKAVESNMAVLMNRGHEVGRHESLEAEQESEFVIKKLSTLLAEIAISLKGEDLALHRHSYHDLNDLVKAHMVDSERYRFLRNHPNDAMGMVGLPQIAIPEAYQIGDFVTGEEADSAIDNFKPSCNKCKASITTGMMALFCEHGNECEFYTAEIEEFKAPAYKDKD